ncbi:MAG: UPF0149 family protein [Pseudomonadota bacterium]|nr:UPF0149 family protein [Pseudomonadota bacterium]
MALPESAPPSRPPRAAAAQDLGDAELKELDDLLAQVPEPLEPLDVVMLDGFLAAIIVQPELIEAERWLPYVFDAGGHRWGEAELTPAQLRARQLIGRRYAAMNGSLAEYRSFDPLILEPEEESTGQGEAEPRLDATTRAILPWVAGFEFAASIFAGLDDLDDAAVATALARLYRFLPADSEEEQATHAIVAKERPLDSLDDAIEEIIACVADLYDLTEPLRYQVETVRRATPKVGRNDPCSCGSGRKFKHCHGA